MSLYANYFWVLRPIFYLAQELTNVRTVILFKAPGTPTMAFLQRDMCKFRKKKLAELFKGEEKE